VGAVRLLLGQERTPNLAYEAEAHPRRRFNEDRKRVFGGSERLIAFICECSDPDCRETVMLTERQYDARRPGLVVRDGHDSGAVL
jgi:hypothetical protein